MISEHPDEEKLSLIAHIRIAIMAGRIFTAVGFLLGGFTGWTLHSWNKSPVFVGIVVGGLVLMLIYIIWGWGRSMSLPKKAAELHAE